ncbi:MAG: S-layer protein [archaeon]|nr:S-layer protein [archaeon]
MLVALRSLVSLVSISILLILWFRDQLPLIFLLLETAILLLTLLGLIGFNIWLTEKLKGIAGAQLIQPLKVLRPEDFRGIEFRSVIQNLQDCIVVVGSTRSHGPYSRSAVKEDWDSAKRLCDKYGLTNLKADTEVSEEERQTRNLILIGGPLVNELTYQANHELPIQLAQISQPGITDKVICSMISGKRYVGREFGIVEAIPSIYNQHKIMIVAFGLNREGTAAAVQALIDHLDNLSQGNKFNSKYPARIVRVEVFKGEWRIQKFVE